MLVPGSPLETVAITSSALGKAPDGVERIL